MNSPVWVYLLGLAGMGIYGSRILIQWYVSEKSHQVESPGIYWVLASIGAVVLYIYGWLRKDFSIIFGESVGYYIYMWNISVMGLYRKVPRFVFVLQARFPVLILALIIRDFQTFSTTFLHNADVPLNLLLFGVASQLVYEARSVYQLVYSYRRKASFLPLGHWVLAVAGSAMIITYGLIRHDWVLVIGQFSIFFSIRNLMLSLSGPRLDSIETRLLMIRPVHFGYNEQTAANNAFQHDDREEDLQSIALEEFDGMVRLLRNPDIPLIVLNDTPEPATPDSIYPNNWFSTHTDGTLVLYPMFALNRRNERKPGVIQAINEAAGTRRTVDLTGWEEKGKFLESTGSMVLDRKFRVAYACRSPRTSEPVLNDFCRRMGYRPVLFDAVDRKGNPIYHTNLVMSVGHDFAVICPEVIISAPERMVIERNLLSTGRRIIRISYEQMLHYAGNILEVKDSHGNFYVVMSDTAREILTEEQVASIGESCTVLAAHIPCIENVGGGSARCMLAEVFCTGRR